MRYRHWLLAGAGFFLIVMILSMRGARIITLITGTRMFVPFGDMAIMGMIFAIAFQLSWTILEAAHALGKQRPPNCPHCGYSLMGVKCPECGKHAGDDD